MMNWSYRYFGLGFTNFVISRTVGPVYTSGPDIPSMLQDVRAHESRNINALVGYVVEGLEEMNEELVDGYLEEMIKSVEAHCHGKPGHPLCPAAGISTRELRPDGAQDSGWTCPVRHSMAWTRGCGDHGHAIGFSEP